jgi:hypothetical protein
MAAFFLVYYYGALRDSDKAEIIIDIIFAIAKVVTGDTFRTQLPRYQSVQGLRCDVVLSTGHVVQLEQSAKRCWQSLFDRFQAPQQPFVFNT